MSMIDEPSRRQVLAGAGAVGSSLMTYALLSTLFADELFAEESRREAGAWLAGVNDISRDLRGQKITQAQWQEKVEALFARVPLEDLRRSVDFEKVARDAQFRDRGETVYSHPLPDVEGVPRERVFGHQIFGMTKGRSVVPHGHQRMATSFQILAGEFRGRHYDRVEDHKDHMVIKPTLDRAFVAGEHATISDDKDNVHWFEATSETAFIFNIHVVNLPSERFKSGGRVYIDPAGEKLDGGLIKAPKITHRQSLERYG